MALAIPLLMVTFAGGTLVLLGWLGRVGRLAPNRWAGIRTPYTLSNADAWYATHRNAGMAFILGGAAVGALGLAVLPFAAADAVPEGLVAAVLGAQAVLGLGTALGGWIWGTRAAKRELAPQ